MRREIEKLQRYWDCNIQIFSESTFNYDSLTLHLQKLSDFENPDFYSKIDNHILILEHFEFDSTHSGKNGSEYKIDFARVNRQLESLEPNSSGEAFLKEEIHCSHNSNNYIANVTKQFINHYNKIDQYKAHLREEGISNADSVIETCFFIEDVTCLGNMYNNEKDSSITPIFLLHCDKFLDLFEQCTDLNYVLCASSCSQTDYLWVSSRQDISIYREHQIDILNTTIIDFTPHVFGFNILVSDDK